MLSLIADFSYTNYFKPLHLKLNKVKMEGEYQDQQYSFDANARLRDLEEKQRLLKERIFLLGKGLIEERDSTFKDIQEMKKTIILLKEENLRMKEFIQRIVEQLSTVARKEELMILQRQFDLFRS